MVNKVEDKKINLVLRIANTNINGKLRSEIALTGIKGVGRRYSNAVLKKAGIDIGKKAGYFSQEEIDKAVHALNHPSEYGVPSYMFNHQRDKSDNVDKHLLKNSLDQYMREDKEIGKKLNRLRSIRLDAGLKVRKQHTNANGRGHGPAAGNKKKK